MSNKSGYKKQKSLSTVQLLAEAPWFIANLVSTIFSGTILLYVDLLDSFSYIIRNAMVILLSGKLSKDLRYEYNYGVGKIEAVSSLFGDAIVLFGMVLTLFLSVYSFFYPSKPSEFLIAVVGLKFYDIMWDIAIFTKQRKILKINPSALSETNYAAAFGDLLFEHGNLKNKQGALTGVLPTEIIEDDSVLNIIRNNQHSFKELLDSTTETEKSEHVAKLKALISGKYANDTAIVNLVKFVGIE